MFAGRRELEEIHYIDEPDLQVGKLLLGHCAHLQFMSRIRIRMQQADGYCLNALFGQPLKRGPNLRIS